MAVARCGACRRHGNAPARLLDALSGDVDTHAAGVLIAWARDNRAGTPVTREQLLVELPWMLRDTLSTRLDTGIYEREPRSPICVAARILACVCGVLDNTEGLRGGYPARASVR